MTLTDMVEGERGSNGSSEDNPGDVNGNAHHSLNGALKKTDNYNNHDKVQSNEQSGKSSLHANRLQPAKYDNPVGNSQNLNSNRNNARSVRQSKDSSSDERDQQNLVATVSQSYRDIITAIGEDVDRDGLMKTPTRAAKALLYFTQGYSYTVEQVVNEAIFDENHDELVLIKDIEMFSLCEHHLVPFMGKVSVAYLPKGKVLGLSKVARIVEIFSRRLQIQERLTNQIAQAVVEAVNPAGVAVIIEASHMCMVMRGVQKINSKTITSCMLGEFRENSKTREEVLMLCR